MKIKIIDSEYNYETGVSKVTIDTDIGKFTGYAKLNEEDKEFESRYAGCRYAEMRATISYFKEKIKIENTKINKYINYLVNFCIENKKINNKKNKTNNKIKKKMRKIKYYKTQIRMLYKAMHKDFDERVVLIKKIRERKNKIT